MEPVWWLIWSVSYMNEEEWTFARVHEEGAVNVAKAAAEAGAERFLHMSALGADPESPALYGRTKFAGEEAVKAVFPKPPFSGRA